MAYGSWPLVMLILVMLATYGVTLYMAGHAYSDMQQAVLDRFIEDKLLYMQSATRHISNIPGPITDSVIIEEINIIDTSPYTYLLAKKDSTQAYPIIWSHIPHSSPLYVYNDAESLKNLTSCLVRSGRSSQEDVDKIMKALSDDRNTEFMQRYQLVKYPPSSAVWVFMPIYNSKYIYMCVLDEEQINTTLTDYKYKYMILLIVGLVGIGATAVLLPLYLQKHGL